jgi:hypothetical protein
LVLGLRRTIDRICDIRGRQSRGRNLIEQRLKQMIVAPIDYGYIRLRAAQRPRRIEATEARANDHDVRPRARRGD